MFRGAQATKVDDKGRIKLPTETKRLFEERYTELSMYVTSTDGEIVKIYPMSEWLTVESSLQQSGPEAKDSGAAARKKALFLTSVYGSEETLDGQGRILVPAVLRDSAGMRSSDVRLMWLGNRFEALSDKVFAKQLERNALNDAEQNEIAHLGV